MKRLIAHYYYNQDNFNPWVYGLSLMRMYGLFGESLQNCLVLYAWHHDMQLSPLYYRYMKRLIAHYYYSPSNYNPRVYGLSLMRMYGSFGESLLQIQSLSLCSTHGIVNEHMVRAQGWLHNLTLTTTTTTPGCTACPL